MVSDEGIKDIIEKLRMDTKILKERMRKIHRIAEEFHDLTEIPSSSYTPLANAVKMRDNLVRISGKLKEILELSKIDRY